MANDALGQEKQRDYIIKKLIHCIVCPPARWFLYHVIGSLAMTGIITRLFIAPPRERVYGKAKVFCWGWGEGIVHQLIIII